MDQLRIFVHDERSEIELTVANHFGLSFETVIGRFQIETLEIGILHELLHQIGRAGTLRANADRCVFEVLERIDRATASSEQQQRLRLREPPQDLQAGVGGNRHSVLYEGEGWNAAPVFAGEASDVFSTDPAVATTLRRPFFFSARAARRSPVA